MTVLILFSDFFLRKLYTQKLINDVTFFSMGKNNNDSVMHFYMRKAHMRVSCTSSLGQQKIFEIIIRKFPFEFCRNEKKN